MEGATPLQNLWYITLPLASPSLTGAGLFTFMLAYSEFLLALLITNTRIARTVPVTLGSISTNPDVPLAHGRHHDRQHPDDAAHLPCMAVHGARPDDRGGTLGRRIERANGVTGIVGAGFMGRLHGRLLTELPNAEVAGGGGRPPRSGRAGRRRWAYGRIRASSHCSRERATSTRWLWPRRSPSTGRPSRPPRPGLRRVRRRSRSPATCATPTR